MRGEYAYAAAGHEFARERFISKIAGNGRLTLRARVVGEAIGLHMTLEMQSAPDGQPLELKMVCAYRGLKGTAEYHCKPDEILAVLRYAGVERHLRAGVAEPYILIPQPLSAYYQLAMPMCQRASMMVCVVDVYNAEAFLRPRLRRVELQSTTPHRYTTPAGTFSGLQHLCLTDTAPNYPLTGEGYLDPTGCPIFWRQQDGNTTYTLMSYTS